MLSVPLNNCFCFSVENTKPNLQIFSLMLIRNIHLLKNDEPLEQKNDKKSNLQKKYFPNIFYCLLLIWEILKRMSPVSIKKGDNSRFTRDEKFRNCSCWVTVWLKRNRHQDTRNFSHHPSSEHIPPPLRISQQFHLRWSVWKEPQFCNLCSEYAFIRISTSFSLP